MEIESYKKEGVATPDTIAVGIARLGAPDQTIACGKCSELGERDLGAPLHSLVIPAEDLHEIEAEFLDYFKTASAGAS